MVIDEEFEFKRVGDKFLLKRAVLSYQCAKCGRWKRYEFHINKTFSTPEEAEAFARKLFPKGIPKGWRIEDLKLLCPDC